MLNDKIKVIENGTITSVKGFYAEGIHSGFKRKRKDLALIYSDGYCTAAGTFTLNKVKAAPLVISQNIIEQKKLIKAILINSGNANACTGEKGFNNAISIQKYCAEKLNIEQYELLLSSTGVIGEQLDMDTFYKGVDKITSNIKNCTNGKNAAEAILTTDKYKKSIAVEIELSFGKVTIGAIAKGSGMIMPNMATMLAFITTDASINNLLLNKMLKEAVNKSFNRISVDGDTSTNDMVVLLSKLNVKNIITEFSSDYYLFLDALTFVCKELAKMIVQDGEGANKFITVNIHNAFSEKDADLVGKAICNSPLVKTAIYGNDANWGRIASAIGYSNARINPEEIELFINGTKILDQKYSLLLNNESANNLLKQKEVILDINLNIGNSSATWWTCDFTEEYVKINSSYRS